MSSCIWEFSCDFSSLLERDTGNSYLTAQAVETPDDDPSQDRRSLPSAYQ